jgi:hypothetical protein
MSWISVKDELPALTKHDDYFELRSKEVLVKAQNLHHVAYYTKSGYWVLNSLKYILDGVEKWKEIH